MKRMTPSTKGSSQRRHVDRRGVAAVEVAVLLPVFLLLTIGSIEATNATYLKRDVTMAAYVAATDLEDHQGTVATATAKAQEVLAARSISTYTIKVTNTSGVEQSQVDKGQTFQVRVEAPFAGNTLNITKAFNTAKLSATVTMVRSN